MTLKLEKRYKIRREALRKLIFDAKRDLISAYHSQDPTRINTQKRTLARHLLEFSQSPELGPPLTFHWGLLEIVYSNNFDPTVCWDECLAAQGNYFQIARIMEKSLARD